MSGWGGDGDNTQGNGDGDGMQKKVREWGGDRD